jgi:hypothetical protein
MPLNESGRKTRERWPLEFDLAGVPRDNVTRERLLEQQRQARAPETQEETAAMNTHVVPNSFAVDYKAGNTVIDINNPPHKRYVHQEFPKMVYHHESGQTLTVQDEKQLKLALKKGFETKPAADRDYSKTNRNGVAPVKPEPSPEQLTEEEILNASAEEDEG